MRAAGLKAISTVVESSAILIKSKHASNTQLVDLIAARIRGVISKFHMSPPLDPNYTRILPLTRNLKAAQKYVLCTYNIKRAAMGEVFKVTPGKRAPTTTPLEEEGWVAVSVMVESKRIADAMDELERLGAEDIIVTKIENTRTRAVAGTTTP